MTAALAAYLAAPSGTGWEVGFQLGIGLFEFAVMAAGLRRAAARSSWVFLTLGLLGAALGPWLGVVPFMAFYPLMAVGLGLMIRRQRRTDWAAVVDALTVTTGIGLPVWAYALGPAVATGDWVSAAYPMFDLVLFFMTILLLRGNGRSGRRAPLLVATAVGLYMAGDWAWLVSPPTRLLNAEYLVAMFVLSLSIAWPAVRGDGLGASAVAQLTRPQLAVLAPAMLIAPALMITQRLTGGTVDVIADATGSAVMFLLVTVRFTQVLRQSERQAAVVRELSLTDDLTGLPNRRAWTGALPRVLERARSAGTPIVVGMIDLDHFKNFNDTHGHQAGDRLLRRAATAWQDQLRTGDVLARYGGEEFIVLLPSATPDATEVLERLRAVTPQDQTFSAGVARWDGTETSEDLIARADAALYAAKEAGRDRITTAQPAPVEKR